MSCKLGSKTVQKVEKTVHNSVPIVYQHNVEYAVKSGSTSVIVCIWTKMSATDGNSKTVQKFGKTLQNSVPIDYQYNVKYNV